MEPDANRANRPSAGGAPSLKPPQRRVSGGAPSLVVPPRSTERMSVAGQGSGASMPPSIPEKAPSKKILGSAASYKLPKQKKSSKVSIRQSRVSFAATSENVVNYYHSKHDDPATTNDPPAPRVSKRISLTYLQDPVITVYDQRSEEEQKAEEAGGAAEGGSAGRKFMHEYKDKPVKEEEEPLTMEQKMRYIGQKLFRYKAMKVIQAACAIYIAVKTLAPAPLGLRTQPSPSQPITPEGATSRGGFIVDFVHLPSEPASARRTARGYVWDGNSLRAIVCSSKLQLFFIGLTRISAYSMYPCK